MSNFVATGNDEDKETETSAPTPQVSVLSYGEHYQALLEHELADGVHFTAPERISLYGTYKRASLELADLQQLAKGGRS